MAQHNAPSAAQSGPTIGVVVVSWNVCPLLRACLASIRSAGLPTCVVVVDNASADGSAAMVRTEFPEVRLVASTTNLGFTRGNNLGLGALGVVDGADASGAAPRFVLLLNPDAELLPGALATLVATIEARPGVGAVGPLLLNPDGTVQSSRRRFPSLATGLLESTPVAWHWPNNPWARRYRMDDVPPTAGGPVDWVTGAALLLRAEALAALGGFDEGFFMYSEELDLCRRLRAAGWAVYFEPAARVVHHEGQSSGQVAGLRHRHFQRSRVRYFRKHHGRGAGALVRLGVLAQFAAEALLEAAKGALGHRRALRRQRVAAYWALLRDGLG
jgi:N-acetylglucosaminyl-diphospho-decaprenol L-rhamnosyltransferase